MAMSVSELINRPFSLMSHDEKILVVQQGRPRPNLPNFYFPIPDGSRFRLTLYGMHEWLTACGNRKMLFCWPCLLFGQEGNWTRGVGRHAADAEMREHPKTREHIQASLLLRRFEEQLPYAGGGAQCDAALYNTLVQRNQGLVLRVVDAALFALLHRRPPRVATWWLGLSKEELGEAHSFLGCPGQDPDVQEDAALLIRDCPKIGDAAVNAACRAVQQAIRRELSSCQMVSVVLSGHEDAGASRPLRSAVVRFVKDGRPVERFVGYHSSVDPNSCPRLVDQVKQMVSRLGLDLKRVASLSVDGSFSHSLVEALHKELRTTFALPLASLVPAHSHLFWDCLTQSLVAHPPRTDADFDDVHCFLKMLESLVDFLREHRTVLDGLFATGLPLPQVGPVNRPETLDAIRLSRGTLASFFGKEAVSRGADASGVLRHAFRDFLRRPSTAFWLVLLQRLLRLTADVHVALLADSRPFDGDLRERTLGVLKHEKKVGFQAVYMEVHSYFGQEVGPGTVLFDRIRKRFEETLDWVSEFADARLRDLNRLEFADLLNPDRAELGLPPRRLLRQATDRCELLRGPNLLYHELLNLFSSARFKDFQQLLAYLNQYEQRRRMYPKLALLAELVLTLPLRPAAGADLSEPLRDWAGWYMLDVSQFCPEASLLCVERELVAELRRSAAFQEEVVRNFSESYPKMEMLSFIQ